MLVKCCLTPPRRLARCRDPAQGAEEEGRYQQRQQLVQKLVRCLAARESAGFGVVEGEGARKQSGPESPRAALGVEGGRFSTGELHEWIYPLESPHRMGVEERWEG